MALEEGKGRRRERGEGRKWGEGRLFTGEKEKKRERKKKTKERRETIWDNSKTTCGVDLVRETLIGEASLFSSPVSPSITCGCLCVWMIFFFSTVKRRPHFHSITEAIKEKKPYRQ